MHIIKYDKSRYLYITKTNAMDIAVTKLKLIDWLMNLSDEAKLEKLLSVKAEMDDDIVAYNAVGEPMNINAYRAQAEEGLKDMEEERVTSHDDFINEAKSW